MKSKWQLISSIFQLLVGMIAIIAIIALGLLVENVTKWIITLILSCAFVVLGIIGIVDYKSAK